MADPGLSTAIRQLGGELAALHTRLKRLEGSARQSGLKYSAVDGGAITVTDGAGTVRSVIGLQPDGTVTHADLNGGPPLAPDPPAVAATIAGLVIGWDGLLAGAMPLSDFTWVEVHASTSPGFTPGPATLQRTMQAGGAITVPGLTAGTTYYCVLVARNTSGAASPPSAQVSSVPVTTVQTIPPGSITPAMCTFSAGGINVTIAASPPASPNAGDIWYDTTAGNLMKTWTGSTWQAYSFGSGALAAGAVGTTQLANGSVGTGQLASGAVGTGQLATGAVGSAQIADGSVTGTDVAAGTITGNLIQAGAITASLIAAQTITAAQIATGTITASQIAANTITAAQIQANTITAAQIQAGTITAAQIQAGTIGATLLAANIVKAGIVDGTVLTGSTVQNSSTNPRTSINPDGSISITNAAGVVIFKIDPGGAIWWYDQSGNLLMTLQPGGTQLIYASLTGPYGIDFEPPSSPNLLMALFSAASNTLYANPVASPSRAGDIITVIVSAAGATDCTAVTDTKGNTYTLVQSCTAVVPHMQVWQAVNGPGGTGPTVALATTDSWTMTMSAANTQQKNFIAVATSACLSVSPLDFSAQATGTSAAPSVAGTPAAFGDAVMFIASWATAGGAGTVPDGWQLAQQSNISGQQWTSVWYTANVAPSGPITGSAAITSAAWCGVVLGYKAAPAQPLTAAPVPSNATLSPSTQWSDDGNFSCRVTKSGAAASWGLTTPGFPVQPGQAVAVRVVIGTLNVALGALSTGITFWSGPNGTGTNLGRWFATWGTLGFNAFFPLTMYNSYAPSNAVSATVDITEGQADTAGNWFLVDNIVVPGGLAYSNSPVATADALGNPVPQGINFMGLAGVSNVLGVTDPYVGRQLASMDGYGNVTGQNISANTDVQLGGQSLLNDLLPNYSLGMVTRGWCFAAGNWPSTPIGTSETPVLELDFIIPAGRAYIIQLLQATFIPTVSANTQMIQRLKYTTDGSTPTTSSTQVANHSPGVQGIAVANSGQNLPTPYMEWCPPIPVSDTTYRVLVTAQIQSGTFQYALGSETLEMRVTDLGNNAPVNNGVMLGTGTGGGTGAQTVTEYFYGNNTWTYWEYGQRNHNGTIYQGAYSGEGYAQYCYIQWSAGSRGGFLNTVLGYSVQKVTLRLLNQHSWYNSGATVSFHSSTALGSSSALSSELDSWHINEGQMLTHALPVGAWTPFKAGGTTYAVLRPPSGSVALDYYSYFWGGGTNNANVPMLAVTYTH